MDILTIGDATLDYFNVLETASVACNIDKTRCTIGFDFGAKVPVKDTYSALGGNALNVALACKTLGLDSGMYSELGDDDTGNIIYDRLKETGLSLAYVKKRRTAKTNHSSILSYKNERTIFSYHAPKKYSLPKNIKAKWLYVTSLSKGCESLYPGIIKMAVKNETQLAFGPGSYHLRKGLSSFKKLLSHTALFIANDTEVEKIFSVKMTGNMEAFARKAFKKIHAIGPKYIVMSIGKKGLYASDGNDLYFLRAYPGRVKEKTGAGDALSAGILAALINRENFDDALIWGSINAASTLLEIGAQNGHQTKQQIIRKKNAAKSYKVRVIS